MKIRCVANTGTNVPNNWFPTNWGFSRDTDFNVTINKDYIVYGFSIIYGNIWYYILDDCNLSYPVWKPSLLFTIIDPRLSKHWEISINNELSSEKNGVLVAFHEWVIDRLFYDRLTDGIENDKKIFERYKNLIDTEVKNEATNAGKMPT